ncbi:MAG TPA: UDP-N-acetylmuramoyl-L-alanyl-D-glutamate--2,6-diaminopimelate ligase [Verrucomicrobiae bacterium]|nr:UDP-N-acetylmuramoyl-L-alanyl-D-glutamate--2,6-diaminopimelate ligase [Verrucomicrobiae bacterium]
MEDLKKRARQLLPTKAVWLAEEAYRWGRVYAVSAKYGNPARSLRVIAVTGTNGKTTTANYLNEILKAAGHRTAMFTTAVIEVAGQRQLNDLNATVASTERMQQFFRDAKQAKVDFVVLEITSHALHQHKLATVPIECAIMTNLTQDHLDYHKTMDAYAEAKGMLFAKKPRFIVLNRDDQWFEFFDKYEPGEHKINYGTSENAEFRITKVKLFKKGSEVHIEADHQTKMDLATALPGKFNVYNLTAAAAAAYMLGIDLTAIKEGAAQLTAIPGRFERPVEGLTYEVIVDYAHTPDALTQLLEAVRNLTKGRVILVFGATGDRDKGKRPIMGEIAAKHADRIFLTDEESYNEDPSTIRQMVMEGIVAGKGSGKTEEIADRRAAIEKALSIARRDDTVVITGMGHEQFRIVNGERLPWNDSEVVRKIIKTK